jgi:bifunctional non-homologous end joining protein LigD
VIKSGVPPAKVATVWRDDPALVRPMAASTTDAPPDKDLENPALVYEPKFDGIRALVLLEPATGQPRVRLWSRNGNDKTSQFPEVVKGLREFALRLKAPVLLDGEIVALDARGEPGGFQQLQGRMHLKGERDIAREATAQRAAFIAFDILRDGGEDLRPLILTHRRARLERIFGASGSSEVRHGEYAAGDGRRLYARAIEQGWEGLVAKRADSRYESDRRSPSWIKLKIKKIESLVVGGWTEPRETRKYFGALVLGAFTSEAPDAKLRYVGHVGSGYTDRELTRIARMLRACAIERTPFDGPVPANEAIHWIEPKLVAEVTFTGWTNEPHLRHAVYLGLRDDVDPRSITLESARVPASKASETSPSAKRAVQMWRGMQKAKAGTKGKLAPAAAKRAAVSGPVGIPTTPELDALIAKLQEMEDAKKDGVVTLPGGETLEVTNLRKVFWPTDGYTKGDLLRFYARVSPWLLPVVAERPLVMKRFPNGVNGKAFYQQKAPDVVPPGIRAEDTVDDEGADTITRRLVGGDLKTLLYMAQLGTISQDPWFSKYDTPHAADYVALDLDPMPGVPFSQVLDVARWVRDELERLEVPGVPKTSGSSGLHVYIPLPQGTSYEAGRLLCEILATIVAHKHRKEATVERTVGKRGRTVYVDYLQNILGKTLATAYSPRASEFGGVSTPLTWDEVDEGISPGDFTIRTAPARFAAMPDLWRPVIAGPPVDLHGVLERMARDPNR